ncbi:hypothetical protein PsorP6_013806 [Peronosclerospora sorghi]|uniref:Uncharacterized protein n=1 Tax=Peronosclerospora sorghi TaxID=230839 RepID=A0ACC0VHC4_9STRA|nr:hypothetical protein PsorP6_013806 [Peronosclerospora sorghi]
MEMSKKTFGFSSRAELKSATEVGDSCLRVKARAGRDNNLIIRVEDNESGWMDTPSVDKSLVRKMNFDLPHGVSQGVFCVPRRYRGKLKKIDKSMDWMEQKDKIERKKRHSRSKSVKKANWVSRSRAARDVTTYSWRFIKVSEPVYDVDIEIYPYELVRRERLRDDEMEYENQEYQRKYFQACFKQWQQEDGLSVMQSQQERTTTNIMEKFDSDYIQTAANAMRGWNVEGKLRVNAYFGRTLFRLHNLNDYREFRLSDLHKMCGRYNLQSSWSNVIDDTVPAMRRLLDELMRTGSVNMQASSPRLIVRIGYKSVNGPQSAIVTYNLNRDKWVLSTVKRLSDTGFYHDISLDNQMNFRVKVYSETSGTPWWNSVPNFLLLDDSNGDPFSTKVSLLSCPDKKLRIEFVTIKKVFRPVKYRGLLFRLSTNQDCTFLKALPSREILAENQVDKCFEVLVSRLVEILDELNVGT